MLDIPGRRGFLRVGAASLLGLTTADWFRLSGQTALGAPKAKSVIQLWMAGGPTQTDTWDPKPNAGEDFTGPLRRPVATNVTGIQIGECFPRIAPGFEQPWKPGNPDWYGRLHATLQSIRNRCEVQIETAADGGFFVKVVVYKELEDLARPSRVTEGGASFQTDITVERQFDAQENAPEKAPEPS